MAPLLARAGHRAQPGQIVGPRHARPRGLRVAPVPPLRVELDRACARLPRTSQVETEEQAPQSNQGTSINSAYRFAGQAIREIQSDDCHTPNYKRLAHRKSDTPTALDALLPRTLLNRVSASRIKLLQREMGVQVDGIVGPQTLSAFERREDLRVAALILALATAQTASYRALGNFSIYGAGWLARTARRQAAALRSAQEALAVAQLQATTA